MSLRGIVLDRIDSHAGLELRLPRPATPAAITLVLDTPILRPDPICLPARGRGAPRDKCRPHLALRAAANRCNLDASTIIGQLDQADLCLLYTSDAADE